MTQLIIKGALYLSGDATMVLRPHYSGAMFAVDCTEFHKREHILENYSEEDANEFLENSPVTVQGVEYFECEYSPHYTEKMELLSDLSKLEFHEEDYDFS